MDHLFKNVFKNRAISTIVFYQLVKIGEIQKSCNVKFKKWNNLTFNFICKRKMLYLLKYWLNYHFDKMESINKETELWNKLPFSLENYDDRLDDYKMLFNFSSVSLFLRNCNDFELFKMVYTRFKHFFDLARDTISCEQFYQYPRIIEDACQAGNIQIVQYLLDEGFKILDEGFKFGYAAASGDMKLVELLASKTKVTYSMISSLMYDTKIPSEMRDDTLLYLIKLVDIEGEPFLFTNTLQNGCIKTLEYLIDSNKISIASDDFFNNKKFSPMDVALTVSKEIFQYIRLLCVQHGKDHAISHSKVKFLVKYFGHDQAVFFELFGLLDNQEFAHCQAMANAIKYGHMELLRALESMFRITEQTAQILYQSALASRNVNALEYLFNSSYILPLDGEMVDPYVLDYVDDDRLDLMRVLAENSMYIFKKDTMTAAAKHGNIEMIQFLESSRNEGYSPQALSWCIAAGRSSEAVDFFLTHHLSFFNLKLEEPVKNACIHGNNQLVFKLIAYGFNVSPDVMEEAAATDNLELVAYLDENRDLRYSFAVMNRALENGCLGVVKYLHENRTEGCTSAGVDRALANGHTKVIEFLVENRKERWTSKGIHQALVNGHIKLVRYAMSVTHSVTKLFAFHRPYPDKRRSGYMQAMRFYYYMGILEKEDIQKKLENSHNQVDSKIFYSNLLNPQEKINSWYHIYANNLNNLRTRSFIERVRFKFVYYTLYFKIKFKIK